MTGVLVIAQFDLYGLALINNSEKEIFWKEIFNHIWKECTRHCFTDKKKIFKSSEHIRKKVDRPYFEVSAKNASSLAL